jgi:hypothetical protein
MTGIATAIVMNNGPSADMVGGVVTVTEIAMIVGTGVAGGIATGTIDTGIVTTGVAMTTDGIATNATAITTATKGREFHHGGNGESKSKTFSGPPCI